jgi:signal transduction histidine kinase
MGNPFQGMTQLDQADSVKYYMAQSRLKNGFDSVYFFKAINILRNFKYSADQLNKTNDIINSFNISDNKDTVLLLKNELIFGLTEKDYDPAINYSLKVFEEFKNYVSPYKNQQLYLLLVYLRIPYRNSARITEGIEFYNKAVQFFIARKDSFLVSISYYVLEGLYYNVGLLEQSVYSGKKSLQFIGEYKNFKDDLLFGRRFNSRLRYLITTTSLAEKLSQLGKMNEALKFSYEALRWGKEYNISPANVAVIYRDLINTYVLSNQIDSASKYVSLATPDSLQTNLQDYSNIVTTRQAKARYFTTLGKYEIADSIIRSCYPVIEKFSIPTFSFSGIIFPWYYHAIIKVKQNKPAEALSILEKGIPKVVHSRQASLLMLKLKAELCSQLKLYAEAVTSYEAYNRLMEQIKNDQQKVGNLSFETEQQIAENNYAIERLQSENKLNSLQLKFIIIVAILMIAIAVIAYIRYKQQQRLLIQLKNTQGQLIQAEKMASLGELTAGIAHEIQNPLNFVNNFSEVSNELIDEMKTELDKGEIIAAKEIAEDVKQNLEKIAHHGKRADSIVKGMLQHSRSSTGQKELTDINALCDEYLRLAYHGLRAKDKSFNANFEMNADAAIPQLKLVQQDIGRVVLNLISNAFYAVNERKKGASADYIPLVTVSTRSEKNGVAIIVEDNGAGIPKSVQQKIFQPFFTTKPAGQGTGLGLSLSYDIIKAHGGSIHMESKEGEGTRFFIYLPTS